MRIIAHIVVGIVGYRLLLVKFIELEPRQELSYSYSWTGPKVNLYEEFIYPMFHFTQR